MVDVLKDALIDSIKLLPFLFIVYVFMEFVEHKASNKTQKIIKKSGKFGPLIGSVLGAFPQCGFSVMASNLYVGRIITLGTLIAIYLSTSDEMIPVMLSNGATGKLLMIVFFKIITGIIIGFIIDLFVSKKRSSSNKEIHKLCEHDHCHCEEENFFVSSLKHTLKIFIFILLINVVLDITIHFIGEGSIASLLKQNDFIGPVLSGLVGLIPNCAASVVITELFINETISLGSAISGLLASSGVGILVLFRMNKNIKENIFILSLTFLISISIGILFNILNIIV